MGRKRQEIRLDSRLCEDLGTGDWGLGTRPGGYYGREACSVGEGSGPSPQSPVPLSPYGTGGIVGYVMPNCSRYVAYFVGS